MLKIFSKLFYPFLILILIGFLAWKNYIPGTILSGWDTLHPEFNFSLYLERAFFGAWQEHQGLGAPAAQAHAAEMTRLPVTYLLSLVLPMAMVRYSFFFLILAVGALGAYFLSNYFLAGKKYAKGASLLGAVFYVLNLATLQQFFTPFEMFAVHFASLPWLVLLSARYLKEGGGRNLVWFCVVTLLSSSMAHTATLFYVYFVSFSLFILLSSILAWKKSVLKRGVFLIILTVVLNLFWLGPNIYYVFNESATVSNSKISRTFSDEAYLQSRSFGNIESLGLLKNFPFNWREYDFSTNSFEDLMRKWESHLSKPWVKEIGYGSVIFAALGIIVAAIGRNRYSLALLPVLTLSLFFWLNGVPKEITLLREALRFPFTKFSVLLVLTLSVFLAFSSELVMRFLGKIKLGFLFVVLGMVSLIYFMLPAFQGGFIDSSMKVNIPGEYYEAFKWFNSQNPNARIAKLPIQTMWHWNFYSWDYQGGGFTWFGIPQPTLDREFDRWGRFNEDFYFESSGALYGSDPEAFFLTLKKYQVKYLLLDESVINAGGTSDLLYIPQIKEILSKSSDIREAARFGFLTVYETNYDIGDKFVSAPKTEIVNELPSLRKGNLLVLEDLSVNRGFSEAYNCDIKKVGTVSKENSLFGILYRADGGGVSCDYLSYPDLRYDKAYILHIAGENKEGRSLKIYFTNHKTGRADIEELMPEGKFDEEFPVFPSKLEGEGYALNFETRSYGRIASENLVTKVEISEATPSATFRGERSIENDLRVLGVKKYGTWAYKVDVERDGLLQLGQGYEPGWLGLMIQNSRLKTLDDEIFNGWSNSWFIPPNQSDNQTTIYLVYWPQLLEWAGMVLGIAVLLTLFRYRLY